MKNVALLGLTLCVLAVYGQGNLVNLDAKNQFDIVVIIDGPEKMNGDMFADIDAFGDFEGVGEFLAEVKNSSLKSDIGGPDQKKIHMGNANIALVSVINGKAQMKMVTGTNKVKKINEAIKAAIQMLTPGTRQKFLILIGAHDSLLLTAELREFDKDLQGKKIISMIMVPHFQQQLNIDYDAIEKMAEQMTANETTTQ